ncbi:hypothetical protein [Burkholderia ubonensis]|nr:hypothetical protein [Burkholderia ubonensis]
MSMPFCAARFKMARDTLQTSDDGPNFCEVADDGRIFLLEC